MIDWKALKKEVDDEHGALDECECSDCIKLIEEAVSEGWRCEICGYDGEPFSFACACYDENAAYCFPRSPGTGCFHGQLGCPLCDEGERLDVVTRALVRALRRAPEPLSRQLFAEAKKVAIETGQPVVITQQKVASSEEIEELKRVLKPRPKSDRPRLQANHTKPEPETRTESDKPWRDPCPKCKTPANPRAYSCKNCDHSWLPVATQEHDILQGFYKVAIAERDHERHLALKAEAQVKALRKEAEALAAESEEARSGESEELQILREELAAARIERDDARRLAVDLYENFPDPTYENSTLDRWKANDPKLEHESVSAQGYERIVQLLLNHAKLQHDHDYLSAPPADLIELYLVELRAHQRGEGHG